jgi:dipeptidyl aminopeptidase/acylaminoacyl peptidase
MRRSLWTRVLAPAVYFGFWLGVFSASPELARPQEAVLSPAENLVVDGLPQIPMVLVDSAAAYNTFRAASFDDWHPTKRQMLISTRFADTPQLHLVSMPGGARQQITFFPDGITAASFEPGDGDSIVFMKDTNGGEWYQLYRYETGTGQIRLLTDGGKSRNVLGPWSSKGDRFAYTSTKRTGKDTDLWTMNPELHQTNRLMVELSGGGWRPLDWSPDDKTILLLEEVSINESYLWLVDTTKKEKTALTPRKEGEKVSYRDAKFSPDGKGIYVTTDRDSEFSRLAYMELSGAQPKYLTSGIPWDVEEFDVTQDGTRIAFVTNEDGTSKLHAIQAKSGKEISLPQLPIGVLSGLRWHRNGQELGFSLNTARTPTDCYSLEVTTGKLERWTFSESALKTDSFSVPELVRWKSFDGKTISGFLYRPLPKFWGKRPVMVVIHGGPEGQSQPVFIGRNNYFLNQLGIALLFPNVRGSTGYGKTFSQLDNGFKREDSYKDIAALFDWIAARPDLDADRVAVTGGSYGGHMTLAVSTFYSDRIRCSIDVVGMSNLVTFLEHTEAYRRDLRRVEYGDERDPKMREFLEKIAPMNNIAKIKKPMFVIAGKNDPRVPVTESEQIVAALKENKTPVWYLMAKDEGHGFRKKSNQDFQFYSSVIFLEEHLLK